MVDENLVLRGQGNVDVQVGGAGNPWKYLSACAWMSGPTVPKGGTEIRKCQDPNKANGFKISSKFKTAADQITYDLMTKLGKVDYLNDLDCPFSLRARYAKCGIREDVSNFDPLMLTYCESDLTEKSYEDLVINDDANQDEIVVTTPATASYEYRVEKTEKAREGLAADLGDQPVNDIEYCDYVSCGGYCGDKSDGCSTVYAVTDADTTPYTNPNLLKGVKSATTGVFTWTVAPILVFNSNAVGVECAGDRIFASSNGDSAVAWNAHGGDQNEWNLVTLAHAPSTNHNALFARTSREVWQGCADGYIYKSVDGGQTFTAVHEGTITTQTINAVFAYDKDLVYAAGNAGVILKSVDGGQTWEDKTEVATVAANLLCVIVPPNRPKEVYVAASKIYRSKNAGDTFTAISFDGDGVGTVDDLAFCGPCAGDVMWILHNDAGPRARILRDLSGGAGGADVEIVMDWFDIVPTGIDLNALACCGVNTAIAAGENYGGYPVVVKIS